MIRQIRRWFVCLLSVVCTVETSFVCVNNVANDDEAAAVFRRGVLERYGSKHTYHLKSASERWCLAGGVVEKSEIEHINLIPVNAATSLCGSSTMCIVVGDRHCNFDPHWKRSGRVIFRQYSSTKYPYPGLPLGPRYEFGWIATRDKRGGNRKYMFNFDGRIDPQDEGRVDMKMAVSNYAWTVQTQWIERETDVWPFSDESAERFYREMLLASSFTLCPVGESEDSHRFWEAIEAGSIPIFVPRIDEFGKEQHDFDRECPGAFDDVLKTDPPIVILSSWHQLPAFIESQTEAEISERRSRLLAWNNKFWRNVTRAVDDVVSKSAAQRAKRAAMVQQKTDKLAFALELSKTAATKRAKLAAVSMGYTVRINIE